MSEQKLNASGRTSTGKANMRRLRRTGFIPCTIYGAEDQSKSLSINRKEVEKLLSGAHSVINVLIDGKEENCVIKEIQRHPVKDQVIHMDLQRVRAGQEIQLSVPIKFIGEAPGIKMGGVFQTIRSELDISTLPKYLPDEIVIDVSSMEIGDSMHVRDLKLENITIHDELDASICSVILPKKIEEEVEEEEGEEFETEEEETEPEVISSKHKEEDEEQDKDKG